MDNNTKRILGQSKPAANDSQAVGGEPDIREVLRRDYHIPGIRPRYYLPLFILTFFLWTQINPNWYLEGWGGKAEILFLTFAVFVFGGVSALSTFFSRMKKRSRK